MAPTAVAEPNPAEVDQIDFKWMYGDAGTGPKFSKFAGVMNPMRWSARANQDALMGQLLSANPAGRDGNTMKRPVRVAWKGGVTAVGKGCFNCSTYGELRAELSKIRGHEARVKEQKGMSDVTASEGTGFPSEMCSAFQSELMGVGEYAAPVGPTPIAVVESLTVDDQPSWASVGAGGRNWTTPASVGADGRPPQLASAA